MSDLLRRLDDAGVLHPVDTALGQLLVQHSPRDADLVGAAAALASAALAQGHSCLPLAQVHNLIATLAADAAALVLPSAAQWREALSRSPLVALDANTPAALVLDGERVYLRRYFRYERAIAADLRTRLAQPLELLGDEAVIRAALARHFQASDSAQARAALLALRSRVLIVSGAPGTGKTTTVLRLLALRTELELRAGRGAPRVALAAPTGKAAARLSETIRAQLDSIDAAVRPHLPQTATTVHRLLGVFAGRNAARYDADDPLPFDTVVIDEASMLDLALAARLHAALLPATQLLLVGDRHQLASVEAGSVFGALCDAAGRPHGYSGACARWLHAMLGSDAPCNADPPALADAFVELDRSHRFGPGGAIGRLAAAVLVGDTAAAAGVLENGNEGIHARAVEPPLLAAAVGSEIVPHYEALLAVAEPQAAFALAERYRVLCAMREGAYGATTLNAAIERELRRRAGRVDADGWYHGRLVMITTNDHRRHLFNGDIGVALASASSGALEVWFAAADGSLRALPPVLLPAHQGAFAMTVHKAQGSEFEQVLIVLPPRDVRVLGRELLYTAITRARRKVELWTSPEVFAAALARSTQRWSGLTDALSAPNAPTHSNRRAQTDPV